MSNCCIFTFVWRSYFKESSCSFQNIFILSTSQFFFNHIISVIKKCCEVFFFFHHKPFIVRLCVHHFKKNQIGILFKFSLKKRFIAIQFSSQFFHPYCHYWHCHYSHFFYCKVLNITLVLSQHFEIMLQGPG